MSASQRKFLTRKHAVEANYSGHRGSFGALACVFDRCDFTKMRPTQMTFASGTELTLYKECNFDHSKFSRIVAGVVRFEGCSFLDVSIDGFFGHAAEFVDCQFSGVLRRSAFFGRVSGVHINTTERIRNEFRGNDFSAARFVDVDFRAGIDLSLQQLPTGDEYVYLKNASKVLQCLRLKYIEQPHSNRREGVFRFLKQAEQQVANGQSNLFWCKTSLSQLERESRDAIWEELRSCGA